MTGQSLGQKNVSAAKRDGRDIPFRGCPGVPEQTARGQDGPLVDDECPCVACRSDLAGLAECMKGDGK